MKSAARIGRIRRIPALYEQTRTFCGWGSGHDVHLRHEATPALDHIAKRCLAKDPEDRWQTAHDLLVQFIYTTTAACSATVTRPVTHRRSACQRTGNRANSGDFEAEGWRKAVVLKSTAFWGPPSSGRIGGVSVADPSSVDRQATTVRWRRSGPQGALLARQPLRHRVLLVEDAPQLPGERKHAPVVVLRRAGKGGQDPVTTYASMASR
jgi:hypothetical protein